jgi:hypothetical protein
MYPQCDLNLFWSKELIILKIKIHSIQFDLMSCLKNCDLIQFKFFDKVIFLLGIFLFSFNSTKIFHDSLHNVLIKKNWKTMRHHHKSTTSGHKIHKSSFLFHSLLRSHSRIVNRHSSSSFHSKLRHWNVNKKNPNFAFLLFYLKS